MTIARMLYVVVAVAIGVAGVKGDAPRSVAVGGATFAAGVDPAGLVVTSLRSGSGASGLRVGDVVDRIDGTSRPGIARMATVAHEGHAVLRVHRRGDAGERTLLLIARGGGA